MCEAPTTSGPLLSSCAQRAMHVRRLASALQDTDEAFHLLPFWRLCRHWPGTDTRRQGIEFADRLAAPPQFCDLPEHPCLLPLVLFHWPRLGLCLCLCGRAPLAVASTARPTDSHGSFGHEAEVLRGVCAKLLLDTKGLQGRSSVSQKPNAEHNTDT